MAIKVSVVVAAYNPGKYVEPLLDSLTRQTMPAQDFEVILVDDGSTDGTSSRFDDLAAAHDNVTVIHIPNSGWPGRPRNIGIDAARGEFVQFVDADDHLGVEALERMHALGARTGADIVIGRITSSERGVPGSLFAENRERVTVMTAPLLESMTCHKMFRRSLLDVHGIRFPEGRRRLEDHVFVVQAYLLAGRVSVLSDYTCYYLTRRDDGGNISAERFEPAGYFENLREAIQAAEALTKPGALRDRVMRRWYATEMLKRLGGKVFLRYPDAYRRQMYDEIRRLALERFTSPGVWAPLAPQLRIRSELLRQGRYDDLLAMAQVESGLRLQATLSAAHWSEGRLTLSVSAQVRCDDHELSYARRDGRTYVDVPVDGVSDAARDVTGVVARVSAEVLLQLRDTQTRLARSLVLEAHPSSEQVRFEGTTQLDFAGTAPGAVNALDALGDGVWDVSVKLANWGMATLSARVRADDALPEALPDRLRRGDALPTAVVGDPGGDALPAAVVRNPGGDGLPAAVVGDPATVVIPYRTKFGNLSIDVGQHVQSLADRVRTDTLKPRFSVEGPGLVVRIPLHAHFAQGTPPLSVALSVVDTAPAAEATGTDEVRAAGQIVGEDEVAVLMGLVPLPIGRGMTLSLATSSGRLRPTGVHLPPMPASFGSRIARAVKAVRIPG